MIASAHIIGGRFLGGAELFYARLVTALHRHGHATLAVTVPGSLIATELPAEIPRIHIPMWGVWDLWSRWQIQKAMRGHGPNIVQTYMGRATRLTHLPSGRQPIHIARLGGYYEPHGYRHAHAWIVVSPGIGDHLIRHGFPKDRIFHISNFVTPCPSSPPAALQQLRQMLAIPEDGLIAVAVGRLHPIKGFDDLLTAFAAIPRCIQDRPVYLVIVGDGPLAAQLKRHAEQLGIAHRVRWPGWRDDAGRFQELADLCVCSSLQEGVANVILEAWARRRPVLATRTLGPVEIAVHQKDAWLTPVADPAALATSMELLLRNESLRCELADNGYRTLLAHHGEPAIIDAYLDLYRHLLTV
ncbi:MAG: glycosyltransferase [Gammaproteobacteria bacterium]|nr:glycosyltransferase [Gammaproteobacteria bacterium]MCP5198028.1 glycosyltransferase [Gammaproteobacteria bacterium]